MVWETASRHALHNESFANASSLILGAEAIRMIFCTIIALVQVIESKPDDQVHTESYIYCASRISRVKNWHKKRSHQGNSLSEPSIINVDMSGGEEQSRAACDSERATQWVIIFEEIKWAPGRVQSIAMSGHKVICLVFCLKITATEVEFDLALAHGH